MTQTIEAPKPRRIAPPEAHRRADACKRRAAPARAAEADPAAFAARRARRPHGAVRRLRHAGAVCRRHHRRAQPYAQRRPACSMSRIWARRSWSAPITRRWRARSRRWCRPTSSTLRPAASATRSSPTTSGGILDDLMVTRSADPAEDGVLMLVVNAAMQGGGLCAHRRAPARGRAADARRPSRADRRAGADGACAPSGGIVPTPSRCRS